MLNVDERFEKMNAGDADERSGKLDLDGTGVDVGEPFGSIRVALQIQFAHEGGIAADNHHRKQVRHHRHVDQPQDAQHEDGLLLLVDMPHHLPQFDEKFVCVQQLRHDEAAIEGSLNPPAGKDDRFKCLFNAAARRVGVLHCGGF